jgi:hypothetical protein
VPFFPQRGKYYLSFILKARENVFIEMEFNSYIIVKKLLIRVKIKKGLEKNVFPPSPFQGSSLRD